MTARGPVPPSARFAPPVGEIGGAGVATCARKAGYSFRPAAHVAGRTAGRGRYTFVYSRSEVRMEVLTVPLVVWGVGGFLALLLLALIDFFR